MAPGPTPPKSSAERPRILAAPGGEVPARDELSRAHFPALDGLRGLAIIMVLFVHFIGDETPVTAAERVVVKLANYGIWGVDLFFVLSGFLITGLLFDAKASPHYFRDFYLRRTLRIFPLYYGVLSFLFILLPALSSAYPAGLAEAADHQAWLWTYTSNIYLARADTWALPYVGHFWSLAVEEHFYLFWPVVVLCSGRAALLRICAALTVSALGLRCLLSFLGAGDVALTVLTPCRLDALCIGAGLAIAARSMGLARLAQAARPWLVALPALVLLISVWHLTQRSWPQILLPLRGTLIALSFGALLVTSLVAPREGALGRILQSRVLRFVGKYSYGLYVYHGVLAIALQERHFLDTLARAIGSHSGALALQATVATLVSLLLSVLSYELFEKHFLRLKGRLAPSAREAPARAHAAISPSP